MADTNSLSVKVRIGSGAFHRFFTEPSYDVLAAKLAEVGSGAFGPEAVLQVTFLDDEDDQCSLTNADDMHTALQLRPGSPLRLCIQRGPDKAGGQDDEGHGEAEQRHGPRWWATHGGQREHEGHRFGPPHHCWKGKGKGKGMDDVFEMRMHFGGKGKGKGMGPPPPPGEDEDEHMEVHFAEKGKGKGWGWGHKGKGHGHHGHHGRGNHPHGWHRFAVSRYGPAPAHRLSNAASIDKDVAIAKIVAAMEGDQEADAWITETLKGAAAIPLEELHLRRRAATGSGRARAAAGQRTSSPRCSASASPRPGAS